MVIKTYEQQLEEVQQAISEIELGAQEAWYGGKKVVKANLVELRKHEKELRSLIRSRKHGGIRVRGATPI